MIRFGNSSSSGGTGDIKSNGSVNFVAAETWLDAGGNFVTVDPVTPSISLGDPVNSAFISPTQIVVAGASSNVILDNSGAVVITDATGITSEYRVIKISLTAAQIKTLNSVPVVAIPAVANRTVEIIRAFAYMKTSTVGFSNVDLLFRPTAGGTQYSIPTILSNPAGRRQTGIPVASDANAIINTNILVSSSLDSAVGDGTVEIIIHYFLSSN